MDGQLTVARESQSFTDDVAGQLADARELVVLRARRGLPVHELRELAWDEQRPDRATRVGATERTPLKAAPTKVVDFVSGPAAYEPDRRCQLSRFGQELANRQAGAVLHYRPIRNQYIYIYILYILIYTYLYIHINMYTFIFTYTYNVGFFRKESGQIKKPQERLLTLCSRNRVHFKNNRTF